MKIELKSRNSGALFVGMFLALATGRYTQGCVAQGREITTKSVLVAHQEEAGSASSQVISRLDKPFLFTYGSWEKKARIEGGKVVLRGEGLNPKGGGGCNVELDLSKSANQCPALRVSVGATNKMAVLRLMLRDVNGQAGTWEFELPAAGKNALLTPKDGASVGKPGSLDKPGKGFDAAHIQQWQLAGDYGNDGPVDVEVSEILLVAPTADIIAKRAELARKEEAEKQKQQQERDALQAKYGKASANSPVVEAIYQIAPDVLALQIQAGKVVPGSLTEYKPQPGDEKRPHDKQVLLVRGGQEIGWLIGSKRDHLVAYEQQTGDPLLEFVADKPDTYMLMSSEDSAYSQAVKPTAVYRKSKPTDWAQPGRGFAMRHIIYLRLPQLLKEGKKYTLQANGLNVTTPEIRFTPEASHIRSEAVHINQIGFRADDPLKRAFLSCWLGTGGTHKYADSLTFHLVADATGKTVYTGKVALAKDAGEPEAMWKNQNFNGTSVYRMDFGDFTTPGKYRVSVEGVGCSYPFEIGPETWKHAFQTQMQGLYNERSGVELGPPYTRFRKPRDFHPADGVPVYQSTYSVLDGGGEFDVAKHPTEKLVPEAWGGYHDAGDWNPRRVTHMKVTRAQLELLELFPAWGKTLKLSIPSAPNVPDMLTEAMFEIDCFRRLQKPDGGVPYGIETATDPIDGEVSWMQSMSAYVYAPDLWSSYIYAGIAARASRLLAPYDPKLAKTYRDSALKAIQYAESEWAKRKTAGTLKTLRWEARDDRNLAALELYCLTKDKHWHDVFLENTALNDPNGSVFAWGDHVQRDHAFLYARLPDTLADAAIKANAHKAVLSEAEKALAYASGNAFNLTTPDKGKPMFLGFYSTPDAIELARAHFLTHDSKYLAGAIAACQFSAGCNPNNMTYTTGLGANPIQHPLHLDSRRTGQPVPPGLTVYGNIDLSQWKDNFTTWPITYYLGAICTPNPYEWPTTEAYFDIFLYPAQTEFTIDIWTPNVFVWGYLAARQQSTLRAGL